jgi:thiamine-monophosphate kinase
VLPLLAGGAQAGNVDILHADARLSCVLAGGDDYELAFTAPVSSRAAVEAAALEARTAVTCIGSIDSAPGLRLLDAAGQLVSGHFASFDHFA